MILDSETIILRQVTVFLDNFFYKTTFNWVLQNTLKEYVLFDWHRCIKDNAITQLHQILRHERTWLNTLAWCRKKSGAGLCMVPSELPYFLELLEYTLSLFDQKYVSRGIQKCLLYLLRSFHMKRAWEPSVFSMWFRLPEAIVYPLVVGRVLKILFLLYTETPSWICKIQLQIHILSNHFLPELK